jgi:DNA-binding transcriptional LysR family regulator
MHLTLRQLTIFDAVARHQSFSRAAEELHLSQPAVSLQVRQLERNLGLPLTEQLGKRVYLTEAGKEVYRTSRQVGERLRELQQALDEQKGLDRGRLAVAVASTVNYFAPRLLAGYSQRFPGVRISLTVTNREGLLQRLEQNDVDIALMGQTPEHLDLVAEPFMENPLVVVASPTHPLAGTRRIPLQALREETFLLREPGSGTRVAMERFFASHGMSLSSGMEMNTNEAIKQAVEAGLGLGLVSWHTVGLELEMGRLTVLDVEDFPIRRQWYVVHRSGKRLSQAAQAFREHVLTEAQGMKRDGLFLDNTRTPAVPTGGRRRKA